MNVINKVVNTFYAPPLGFGAYRFAHVRYQKFVSHVNQKVLEHDTFHEYMSACVLGYKVS